MQNASLPGLALGQERAAIFFFLDSGLRTSLACNNDCPPPPFLSTFAVILKAELMGRHRGWGVKAGEREVLGVQWVPVHVDLLCLIRSSISGIVSSL